MMKRLALLLGVVVAGCSDKPQAPALSNDPVYQNAREGIRFLVPEGWVQSSKAELPAGPVEQERTLVRYQSLVGPAPAALEVSCMDMPADADLAAYLANPSHSVRVWTALGKPVETKLESAPATRFAFRGNDWIKEVTTCRRGKRVYFFVVLHGTKDDRGRDAARQALTTVVWTK